MKTNMFYLLFLILLMRLKTVVNSGNPFEYLNDIYSGIAGHEVNLFKSYDMNVSEDGDNLIYSSSADENENVFVYENRWREFRFIDKTRWRQ